MFGRLRPADPPSVCTPACTSPDDTDDEAAAGMADEAAAEEAIFETTTYNTWIARKTQQNMQTCKLEPGGGQAKRIERTTPDDPHVPNYLERLPKAYLPHGAIPGAGFLGQSRE